MHSHRSRACPVQRKSLPSRKFLGSCEGYRIQKRLSATSRVNRHCGRPSVMWRGSDIYMQRPCTCSAQLHAEEGEMADYPQCDWERTRRSNARAQRAAKTPPLSQLRAKEAQEVTYCMPCTYRNTGPWAHSLSPTHDSWIFLSWSFVNRRVWVIITSFCFRLDRIWLSLLGFTFLICLPQTRSPSCKWSVHLKSENHTRLGRSRAHVVVSVDMVDIMNAKHINLIMIYNLITPVTHINTQASSEASRPCSTLLQ